MSILAAITPPDLGDDDLDALRALLEVAVGPVHLRVPDRATDDIRRLLDRLTPAEQASLVVHRHVELLDEYPLRGIHLPWSTDRQPLPPARTSLSAHAVDEIRGADPRLRCCFLSPVFPAISKPDHARCVDHDAVRTLLAEGKRPPVVALGGITPRRLPAVAALGFDGAAVLGWLWPDRDPAALARRYRELADAFADLNWGETG